jgi:hypothetical protein
MKQQIEVVQAARRLWRTEGRAGSVVAVLLVVAFIGWPLFKLWRNSGAGGER